jgi:hypothetical protein
MLHCDRSCKLLASARPGCEGLSSCSPHFKLGRAWPCGSRWAWTSFETGYPQARTVGCDPAAPVYEVNQAVKPKSSGLTLDPVSQGYTYLWNIDRASVGTCAELVFRFDDGQERVAVFPLVR